MPARRSRPSRAPVTLPPFESAIVREVAPGPDGARIVEVPVRRRRGSRLLAMLTEAERIAVADYCLLAEMVEAGGCSAASAPPSGGPGGFAREGRQSGAVGIAAALRRREDAIGRAPVPIPGAPRPPSRLALFRAFALSPASVADYLGTLGLARSAAREWEVRRAFLAAAAALAALGEGSPERRS